MSAGVPQPLSELAAWTQLASKPDTDVPMFCVMVPVEDAVVHLPG